MTDRKESVPDVSIVIVNWNTRDHLLRCLGSIHRHPPSRPWEAIVVDNASTDGSVAALASIPAVRVIANTQNRGLPAANNQGFIAAKGRYLLVSNPDVQVREGSIDTLCDLLERRPQAAFAIPQIVQAGGSPQPSAGELPRLTEALIGSFARRASGKGFWWSAGQRDEQRVGHGAEACYLVRRDALVAIGPQDERYILDWEGIDWSARAADAGWEVWWTPQATVDHDGGAAIRQVPFSWIVRSHRGMYRYFATRSRPWARVPLSIVVASRCVVKLGAQAVVGSLYDRSHRRASAAPTDSPHV